MNRPPMIVVSPDVEPRGKEHADASISLSDAYQRAVLAAGGLPLCLPATTDRNWLAESIRRSDGLLLTGGDDVEPRLYARSLPTAVRKTVEVTPDGGQRVLRECIIIDEALRQRKPLLAICRGHQVLNVALGGTLIADISRQKPAAANHRRTDRRSEMVHEVRLTPGSLLANIIRKQKLGVNSTHHQAIGRVAPPLRVSARSPDGIIEGLELKPGASYWQPWLLSVQFHPERLADRYADHQALFDAFIQACALSRDKKL